MMEGFVEARKLGTYATAEVRTLFEDWVKGVEQAVLDLVKEAATTHPEEVAQHFDFSEESAIFFLSKLAREGKIRISAVSVA